MWTLSPLLQNIENAYIKLITNKIGELFWDLSKDSSESFTLPKS